MRSHATSAASSPLVTAWYRGRQRLGAPQRRREKLLLRRDLGLDAGEVERRPTVDDEPRHSVILAHAITGPGSRAATMLPTASALAELPLRVPTKTSRSSAESSRGVTARTVAVLGTFCTRAISPNESPASSVLIRSEPISTSALPTRIT